MWVGMWLEKSRINYTTQQVYYDRNKVVLLLAKNYTFKLNFGIHILFKSVLVYGAFNSVGV